MNTKIDLIKQHILDNDPGICVLTKSNSNKEDRIEESFVQYDVIHRGANLNDDRVLMLIKKDAFEYKRVPKIEEEDNVSIWIKVKLECNKYFMLCGSYRQWKIANAAGSQHSRSPLKQLEQVKLFLIQVQEAEKFVQKLCS